MQRLETGKNGESHTVCLRHEIDIKASIQKKRHNEDVGFGKLTIILTNEINFTNDYIMAFYI